LRPVTPKFVSFAKKYHTDGTMKKRPELYTLYLGSEIDAELCTQHRRILEMGRAAWPMDELEVGLDE
jgi:hypothetical protein